MDPTRKTTIRRYTAGECSAREDDVVVETPLAVRLLPEDVTLHLQALPGGLDALAVGFVLSEGILPGPGDLHEVSLDDAGGTVTLRGDFNADALERLGHRWAITTGCGQSVTGRDLDRPGLRSVPEGPSIQAERLIELMTTFTQSMTLWQQTGGVHAAALSDGASLLRTAEDIGRHNAVDRILGQAALAGESTHGRLMLTTGRLSAEMVAKGASGGLGLLASRGAATSQAIDLASRLNMTLAGFVRPGRLNVYCGFQRISAPSGP